MIILRHWSTTYGVSEATARHLSEKFGTRAASGARLGEAGIRNWRSPLWTDIPAIRAEIAYSARNEMAATLDDVLERRTGLQFFSWEAASSGRSRLRLR